MANLYVAEGYAQSGYIQTGITVLWGQKIIFVPRSETTLIQSVPTEIRELDINAFRLALKSLEDDPDGMTFPSTHNHNTTVSLGGISYARIVEIINGYTITFEDGQYSVNLTGANSNIADVVNANQVSVRTNNSAGLINVAEIQYAAFDGGVWVNDTNGTPGVGYPQGTARYPVSSLADAAQIASTLGLTKYYLSGNFTAYQDFSNAHFVSQTGVLHDTINLNGRNFSNCTFEHLRVTGIMGLGSNASNEFTDCYTVNVSNICGAFSGGSAEGNISLYPGRTLSAVNLVVEGDFTVVDMRNVAGTIFSADVASGSLQFINAVAGSLIELNIRGGDVTLAPSCVGGEYWMEGYGVFYNDSTMTLKGNQLLAAPTVDQTATAVWSHPTSTLMATRLAEVWGRLGLDPTKPLITGTSQVTFGDIVMALAEVPGLVTLTRQ